MSKESYLSDNAPSDISHVMLGNEEKRLGVGWVVAARSLGVFFTLFPNPGHENPLDRELPPLRIIIVAVPKWADGTSVLAK